MRSQDSSACLCSNMSRVCWSTLLVSSLHLQHTSTHHSILLYPSSCALLFLFFCIPCGLQAKGTPWLSTAVASPLQHIIWEGPTCSAHLHTSPKEGQGLVAEAEVLVDPNMKWIYVGVGGVGFCSLSLISELQTLSFLFSLVFFS